MGTGQLKGPLVSVVAGLPGKTGVRFSSSHPAPPVLQDKYPPAGLLPIDFASQTFELVPGGPILGFLAGSNGLRVRAAGTGCP